MREILSKWSNGTYTVWYVRDNDCDSYCRGAVGMMMLPTALEDKFTVDGRYRVESLVQVKLVGDPYPGDYSMGRTMRNSASSWNLKFVRQDCSILPDFDGHDIVTVLESDRIRAYHHLIMKNGAPYAWSKTEVLNISGEDQTLEMLSSFSLCHISPIETEERMQDLNFYRLQSRWAQEGKLLKQNLIDLHMEPCWQLMSCQVERYGQVGSMAVRGYFPWGAVEDAKYGYMVGAQLYHPASWQMELYQRDDTVAFSGGLADREFGHWTKVLKPGDSYAAPDAVISAVMGGVDDIAYALCDSQNEAMANIPESEEELPVIFNKYCTTWGNPTEENLTKIVNKIKGKGFKYCVIDCGWFSIDYPGEWWSEQGDWDVNAVRFPEGLKKVTDMVRAAGMIPGIWFEFECIGPLAHSYNTRTDMMLKMDGHVLTEGGKRFYDMKDPKVVEFLSEKVIKLLKDNNFGYLKVDYNGNYGMGPDGEESRGEELRKSMLATQAFFLRIREEIPDIVIENCASGGHREEPSMQAVASMSSFSDAHEPVTIPVIAANLHRAILPRQSQIWAVMRATDSERRVIYSVANTFLGRCCLSGDIYDMSDRQWELIDEGLKFYKEAVPVIRNGKSVIERNETMNYSKPDGAQIVKRTGTEDAEGTMLVVVHQFLNPGDAVMTKVPGAKEILKVYKEDCVNIGIDDGRLVISGMEEYSACAVLLRM